MKLTSMLIVLGIAVGPLPAYCIRPCFITASHDTHAVEDSRSIWRRGERREATQLEVNKQTGQRTFCEHGGYCFLASIPVNGQLVEALPMTNCQIQAGDNGTEDSISVLYGVEGKAPHATPNVGAIFRPSDIQTFEGQCNEGSFSAAAPPKVEASKYSVDFGCDRAVIFVMDSDYRRLRINFFSADPRRDSGILLFSGSMSDDGRTLQVSEMKYLNPSNNTMSADRGSTCVLDFKGEKLRALQCFAQHTTRVQSTT